MSVVNVLRPVSVRQAGGATAVPSGTLATVSADNNDATYINSPTLTQSWSLRVEPHTPAAGYERHQIRGRVRASTNAGTARDDIDVGRGTTAYIRYTSIYPTSVVTEYSTAWFQDAAFGLDTAGALSDLNIGGGYMAAASGGATAIRDAECYIDIDCRLRPQYGPQVRDNAGVDQSSGVVTDTNQPELYFGTVAYDGLPALGWSVSLANSGGTVFDAEGAGEPPASVLVDTGLPDGNYTATFYVTSTIRGADEFGYIQVVDFAILNTVPPPSPPNLTAEREGDGYRLTWSYPGGQTWDDDYVIAEVWRDDCTGSSRIATVTNGLNGSYLDLAIPQLDTEHVNVADVCTVHTETCDVTYRVRYWGYVSTTVEIPDTIPVQLVLAWPSTAASIPAGWLRVTALDGYFPRGATGTSAPIATGGTASHSHTTPSHAHELDEHLHIMLGSTSGSSTSVTTDRFNGASTSTANQSHSHTLPPTTGMSSGAFSGSTAAGTDTQTNSPPAREVIWIRSDGSATQYPIGALGWSAESVSGWTTDATSNGRFLKGAQPAGNGGATSGGATHGHAVLAHTHTGPFHDHANFTTGLSGPAASTEANIGIDPEPRWLGRHTHPGNVVANSGTAIPNVTGGNVGIATMEPPYRALRVLRNTTGGAQTRIIGLYTGAVVDLDPILTLCNGSSGTPDMRGWFARDVGSSSVGVTGGASTHTHSVPSHDHGGVNNHSHVVTIGISTNPSYGRDTSGSLGQVPAEAHTHTADNTGATVARLFAGGSGTTGSSAHIPVYKETHFVRLDGVTAGGPLPVPELKVSEFSSITVPGIVWGDGLDRLTDGTVVLAVPADRAHAYPRLVTDSIPLDGGMHTLSDTLAGEDMSLTIGVEGKAAIDQLEAVLAADRVYWAPLGGTPGWYAPGGWSVAGPAPDVKVLTLTLTRQPWPSTDDPEDLI